MGLRNQGADIQSTCKAGGNHGLANAVPVKRIVALLMAIYPLFVTRVRVTIAVTIDS